MREISLLDPSLFKVQTNSLHVLTEVGMADHKIPKHR